MNTVSKTPGQETELADEPAVGIPTHPLAAGAGAVALGAASGAVVGTAAGPLGTAIGAVAGAIVGGLGGDAVASEIGMAKDAEHRREQDASQGYVRPDTTDEDYGPAYLYGETARQRYGEQEFDDVAGELGLGWEAARGRSRLDWDEARPVARDAWERFGKSISK
jgi:hypothetical protein